MIPADLHILVSHALENSDESRNGFRCQRGDSAHVDKDVPSSQFVVHISQECEYLPMIAQQGEIRRSSDRDLG